MHGEAPVPRNCLRSARQLLRKKGLARPYWTEMAGTTHAQGIHDQNADRACDFGVHEVLAALDHSNSHCTSAVRSPNAGARRDND